MKVPFEEFVGWDRCEKEVGIRKNCGTCNHLLLIRRQVHGLCLVVCTFQVQHTRSMAIFDSIGKQCEAVKESRTWEVKQWWCCLGWAGCWQWEETWARRGLERRRGGMGGDGRGTCCTCGSAVRACGGSASAGACSCAPRCVVKKFRIAGTN